MLSEKLGGERRAVFEEPTFLETSRDEQQGARKSPVKESARDFLLTGVGLLLLIIFMVDLGHEVVYYCLGSSLLRKESGRVFVVPL